MRSGLRSRTGPGESGDQLEAYNWLRRRPDVADEPTLVYLARLGAPAASAPDVETRRWQDFAAMIQKWSAAADIDGRQRWLIGDYLTYLRERGLMMSDPFPLDAREVVARQWNLRHTLDELHTMIRERLGRAGWEGVPVRWAQRTGGPIDYWPGRWWSVYRARPADLYPACDFEVLLTGLTPEDDDDPEPMFSPGLVWREDRDRPNPIEDTDWLLQMLAVRFDDGTRFEIAAEQSKLRRPVLMADVPGRSLADQADVLGAFSHETFKVLEAHAPR